MLDDGESSSSLVSSLPSLPAAGSVGSFAECVAGTLARSSVRSSFSVWWCFHGWLVWEERRWCDAGGSVGLEVCSGSWVTEMISESFASYQLLYWRKHKYIYLYLYVCCACRAVSHRTADMFSCLGSVLLTSRCVQRLQFEQALLALSGCCVVVSRLYFALHSSTEQEMHMKTTQINTEDS